MDFYPLLDQVIARLRQRQRVMYRALQRQFGVDDAYIAASRPGWPDGPDSPPPSSHRLTSTSCRSIRPPSP